MKNSANILIAVLVVAGCILAGMVLSSWQSQKAYAASGPSRLPNSNWIIVSGDISASQSLLYVINIPEKKLMAYFADPSRNVMQPVGRPVDLQK